MTTNDSRHVTQNPLGSDPNFTATHCDCNSSSLLTQIYNLQSDYDKLLNDSKKKYFITTSVLSSVVVVAFASIFSIVIFCKQSIYVPVRKSSLSDERVQTMIREFGRKKSTVKAEEMQQRRSKAECHDADDDDDY
jgi:hypothetical protein